MEQLHSLENKREQHRSKIRKTAHKQLVFEKRQHLLKELQQQPTSLKQLQKICAGNSILEIWYDSLIQQLIQHYDNNKMVVLSSLANLLMEPLNIQQLESIVSFVLQQQLNTFDLEQPVARRIISFLVMALFRQYSRLAEEEQLKLEEQLLPIIFVLMNTKQEEAQLDGLHSIMHILSANEDIEAYYRLKRNNRAVRKLLEVPVLQSLEPQFMRIYVIVARVDIPIMEVMAQMTDPFYSRVTQHISLRYSSMADEEWFHRLKEQTALLVEALVSRREVTNNMVEAILDNWQSLSIDVLYQLSMEYPECINIERSALLSILESIKDKMTYAVCVKDRLFCLKTLYEILKYQYAINGSNAEAICGWRTAGGYHLLEQMEEQKGEVGDMAHTILTDLYDSIQ